VKLAMSGKKIYYYKNSFECDFIIKEKTKITAAIQVTKKIDSMNEKREMGGLLVAMEKFDLKSGLIITEAQEEEKSVNGKTIKIIPLYKWLLKV
jgi:hypothetical protein